MEKWEFLQESTANIVLSIIYLAHTCDKLKTTKMYRSCIKNWNFGEKTVHYSSKTVQ